VLDSWEEHQARKAGREVIERMLTKGRICGSGNNMKFKNSINNQWYYVQDADMAHLKDAVKYWNQKGECHRSKSKKVRSLMRDLDNYELEYFGHNLSQGACLKERYRDSESFIGLIEKSQYF
jgi:hypothetical protein